MIGLGSDKNPDISAVNCTDPPEKPGAGTWEWDESLEYETKISYTCGPYGSFIRLLNIFIVSFV